MDPTTGSVPRPAVDERLVARLWDAQHPFSLPLKTTIGDEIKVVYRGWRRYDRGPDFPGALIAMSGERLVAGDVEIHVRSSDWRRHGHQGDPVYNGVVLHVVMWDDGEPCLREDGVRVPVVALASHLSRPPESLPTLTEADIPRPVPCWRGDLERTSALGRVLELCGMERFEARVRRYEAELTCHSPDQSLYRGIASALGYSQNRGPFERLAELVPLEVALALRERGRVGDRETGRVGEGETQNSEPRTQNPSQSSVPSPQPSASSLGVEALLLGSAGLLPSQRGMPSQPGSYAREMEKGWEAGGAAWAGGSMQAAEWQFFRVRPNNFPTRRLAALAQLLSRWPPEGLAETLVAAALSLPPKRLPRSLESLLLAIPRDGYWALHCDFGLPLRRPTDLIGKQRAAEVVVNVFLPFLAARAEVHSEQELGERAREAYLLYPKRGDNEISRHVAVQVTGIPRPPAARSACRQQGLLHIYRTWCEGKRCTECPISAPP